MKLEGVDTAEKARMFTNVEVYFPKKYVEQDDETEDIPTWNFFIGFKVKDVRHGDLGELRKYMAAVSNKKGVVGSKGRNMPIMPSMS